MLNIYLLSFIFISTNIYAGAYSEQNSCSHYIYNIQHSKKVNVKIEKYSCNEGYSNYVGINNSGNYNHFESLATDKVTIGFQDIDQLKLELLGRYKTLCQGRKKFWSKISQYIDKSDCSEPELIVNNKYDVESIKYQGRLDLTFIRSLDIQTKYLESSLYSTQEAAKQDWAYRCQTWLGVSGKKLLQNCGNPQVKNYAGLLGIESIAIKVVLTTPSSVNPNLISCSCETIEMQDYLTLLEPKYELVLTSDKGLEYVLGTHQNLKSCEREKLKNKKCFKGN